MLYALFISIFLNVILALCIYIITRKYSGLKARNAVLVGNVVEMKKYYDLYNSNTVEHKEEEKDRQEATDEEAKEHLLSIIANNNAEYNKLRKHKNN